MNLEQQVKSLMKEGVYDPDALFKIIYYKNRVHYAKVREAIQRAKNF